MKKMDSPNGSGYYPPLFPFNINNLNLNPSMPYENPMLINHQVHMYRGTTPLPPIHNINAFYNIRSQHIHPPNMVNAYQHIPGPQPQMEHPNMNLSYGTSTHPIEGQQYESDSSNSSGYYSSTPTPPQQLQQQPLQIENDFYAGTYGTFSANPSVPNLLFDEQQVLPLDQQEIWSGTTQQNIPSTVGGLVFEADPAAGPSQDGNPIQFADLENASQNGNNFENATEYLRATQNQNQDQVQSQIWSPPELMITQAVEELDIKEEKVDELSVSPTYRVISVPPVSDENVAGPSYRYEITEENKVESPAKANNETVKPQTRKRQSRVKIIETPSQRQAVQQQLDNMEKNSKRIPCPDCPNRFFTMKCYLTQHANSLHSEKQHRCNICGKRFITVGAVVEHAKAHLKENKPNVCKLCDKAFKHKTDLTKHTRSEHTKEAKFECSACFKRFDRGDQFKQHLRTHGSSTKMTRRTGKAAVNGAQSQDF